MIEERTESRKVSPARRLKETTRSLLVHPPYLRHPSATLDNRHTTVEDIEWVIAYHQEQINLATRELARRIKLEKSRWTRESNE